MTGSYRADIDGMRAVAIGAVVLFHAGLGLPGGFVGVDVFFVISGYLITGILFAELGETGRLSLPNFYARRFARIVPSLFLVVTAVVVAGAVLLSSAMFEVQSLTKSAVAAMLFVGNIYFHFVSSDYFAPAASQFPLLHTWSLGVEEQYYLLWPLLLLAASRVGSGSLRLRCLAAVAAVSVASAAYCAWINAAEPGLAFFSPFSRFWELGLGSALALVEPRVAPRLKAGGQIAALGLALVATGLIVTREGPQFPWPLGLLAAAGTALVILGNGAERANPVSRLLAGAPMVSLGKVSYAWYLWHWPPLAFAEILNVGQPSLGLRLLLVAGSLAAAYLTVWLYENPVRRRARAMAQGQILLAGGAAIASSAVVASGAWAAARYGYLPDDPRLAVAFADRSTRQADCLQNGDAAVVAGGICLAPAQRRRIVVWGDSHADQWVPAVEDWAGRSGWTVEQLTRAAFPPVLGVVPMTLGVADRQCVAFNRMVAARLARTREPVLVVLAANWAPRLDVDRGGTGRAMAIDVHAHGRDAAERALGDGLTKTFALLETHAIPAVVALQSPVLAHAPASCVARLSEKRCGIDRLELQSQTGRTNQVILAAAAGLPGLTILDPSKVLCSEFGCPAILGGRIAYFDSVHVAASVARLPRSQSVWGAAFADVLQPRFASGDLSEKSASREFVRPPAAARPVANAP